MMVSQSCLECSPATRMDPPDRAIANEFSQQVSPRILLRYHGAISMYPYMKTWTILLEFPHLHSEWMTQSLVQSLYSILKRGKTSAGMA